MKSINSPVNTRTSPIKSITSPTGLKVQVITDAAETSVPNKYVVFTEEHLLRIGYKEEVATSQGTNEQRQKAALSELEDQEEQEASVAHRCQASLSAHSDWDSEGNETISGGEEDNDLASLSHSIRNVMDKEAASVSPYSDQDSEGNETTSGEEEEEDNEPASISPHLIRNKTISGGVEDKEASSLSPHSIRNETISVSEEDNKTALLSPHSEGNTTISRGMEDNDPASLSAHSDWDSEENKTISASEEEEKRASLSPHSIRHETISGEEEDNDPASVSPRSEGNETIFISEEDNEPASLFSYSDGDSEGYKTISGGEEEKSPVSLFSYSDRDSEGYKTISAGEEDKEQASYSYSDGYSEGCKIISVSKEDKEPSLLSPHSEWHISASVCGEEAKETSASPKLARDSARALTTSACDEQPEENKETEKHKTYVELFISKIVYHIYIKANMEPQCNDDLIVCLYEYIWEKVKDEDMCITDASFKKMDDEIHKVLHKQLGNPNKVLFLLKYSDKPVVADCMVSILGKLLKRPSKKSNIFCRLFSRGGQIL